ncbi:MAG TPA: peptide deformylase [Candidatus Omnitrophota bacterium]|mgnify:CR=1 FL=1|nr:peptide deformylase [Candidatus Omnitrophota bacterium]
MTTTKLKIRVDGDPCLRKKSSPVEDFGPAEHMLVNLMIDAMYEANGVGLAAPQVGINKRIFVIDIGEGPIIIINPKILKQEGSICCEEGCLSVPQIAIPISRPERIQVQYQDPQNKTIKKWFEGLMARAFLHELDHLDGKLIVDYATDEDLNKYKEQLDKIHASAKL